MKFYDRESETQLLREAEERTQDNAQFTYIMGRRRVGKTALMRNAFTLRPTLYFFVSQKTEPQICAEFVQHAQEVLDIGLGRFDSFGLLFQRLMQESKRTPFTLIIDEIQNFLDINPSIFYDMQKHWDWYKNESHIHLVCCGSMYRLMCRIFEGYREPLYGRADSRFVIRPFRIETLKQILHDHNPNYKPDDLLCLYTLTGGVAKYVEVLMNAKATTRKKMLQTVFSENSFFLNEGRDILVDEFGKDYATYFDILSLLAQGYTSRGDIMSVLNTEVSGHLKRLEEWYTLIRRRLPWGGKSTGKVMRYALDDKFLSFWFRFIYKYRSRIEIGELDYVRDIVERDYETYSGRVLEDYFKEKFLQEHRFTSVTAYWDRKGENEVDIIGLNDDTRTATFIEVKRHKSRIDLDALAAKARNLSHLTEGYTVQVEGLSLEDM